MNEIEVYEEMPVGWRVLEKATTQPVGTKWICNNKSIFEKGYKQALLIVDKELWEERKKKLCKILEKTV